MATADTCLLDSNILLRMSKEDDFRYPVIREALSTLVDKKSRFSLVIERDFEFLPDGRDVHDCWPELLVRHEIRGIRVHDARLAASMYVHQVARLLTINVRDFRRFPGLLVIHPAELGTPKQH